MEMLKWHAHGMEWFNEKQRLYEQRGVQRLKFDKCLH